MNFSVRSTCIWVVKGPEEAKAIHAIKMSFVILDYRSFKIILPIKRKGKNPSSPIISAYPDLSLVELGAKCELAAPSRMGRGLASE